MRNRILALTRNSIPYVRELMPLAKTVAGCILMQQLDYWFERRPDGYYKFLEPSGHQLYRLGDSWCEELGFSKDEFRTAFDRIGVRYKSKGEFVRGEGDKFAGLFYCSYLDRQSNLTWYFRNHVVLDACLQALLEPVPSSPEERELPGNRKSQFTGNQDGQHSVNREAQAHQGIGNVDLQGVEKCHPPYTETTAHTLPKTNTHAVCDRPEGKGGSSLSLVNGQSNQDYLVRNGRVIASRQGCEEHIRERAERDRISEDEAWRRVQAEMIESLDRQDAKKIKVKPQQRPRREGRIATRGWTQGER